MVCLEAEFQAATAQAQRAREDAATEFVKQLRAQIHAERVATHYSPARLAAAREGARTRTSGRCRWSNLWS
jgi:hypothetical protein